MQEQPFDKDEDELYDFDELPASSNISAAGFVEDKSISAAGLSEEQPDLSAAVNPLLNLSGLSQPIQMGRVVVMLPIAVPCSGKTSTFELLQEQFQ